ncbi:MAG: primase C-terminal domain-containing protein [Bacteroidetes bacterium]|nr:primase C-terminal domain-containing protein [Bacteroidota bacterium]
MSEKFIYAEFVEGNIQNRNKIFKTSEFKASTEIECYRSLFLFDEDLKYYVQKTGSTKGYKGNHISDCLIFDFDGSNLEAVKKEAINFVWYLYYDYGIPAEYNRIAFSGSKGFHVLIPFNAVSEKPTARNDFWNVYKNLCLEISKDFNNDKSIYTLNRVIRTSNTINSKSGLYKIPLTFKELEQCSIEEIKKFAKNKRKIQFLPSSEIMPIPVVAELFKNLASQKTVDYSKKEAAISIFSQAAEGERNNRTVQLCGYLINKGLSEPEIKSIVSYWNKENIPPMPESELEEIISGAYKRYSNKNDKPFQVFTIADGLKEYQNFAKRPDSEKVKLGFSRVDTILRGINAGESVCIIGKTSVGKSAFLQNIGLNFSKASKKPTLFFSLEMPITTVVERSIQIESGLTGFEVENLMKGNGSGVQQITELIFTNIPNFFTITESGLNLERIKGYIKFAEENIYKEKTGLILIDYLSLIDGKGNNVYEQVSRVAREIKDLAKEFSVPVIFLSQTTKQYDSYDELTLGSARDSGSVDEASDFVLGIWRNAELKRYSEDQDYPNIHLKLGILKNRRGHIGKISLKMSKKSLLFDEDEQAEKINSNASEMWYQEK